MLAYAIAALLSFLMSEAAILVFALRVHVAKVGVGVGVAERLLDAIEPDLTRWSYELGLPYIRPELSSEGAQLLIRSPARFMKAYLRELRRMVRDNTNYVAL